MHRSSAKGLLKFLLAVAAYYSGILAVYRFIRRSFSARPDFVILMYHRVLDNPYSDTVLTQPGLAVSTHVFERQLAYLSNRFNVLRLDDLADRLKTKRAVRRGSAVITFDDGWKDNFTNAFGLLQKYELPATVFLTANYVGTHRPFWFLMVSWLLREGNLRPDDLTQIMNQATGESYEGESIDRFIEKLKELNPQQQDRVIGAMIDRCGLSMDYWQGQDPMLSWEDVAVMAKGGIDFGSHGCSHRILTKLATGEAETEINASKRIIEQKLGGETRCFSYPNGDSNAHVRNAVEKAGYACAVATGKASRAKSDTDLFALRRVNIHDGISVGPGGNFSRAMFAWHLTRHVWPMHKEG